MAIDNETKRHIDPKAPKVRLVCEINKQLNDDFTAWARRRGLSKTALITLAMEDYLRKWQKRGLK